MSTTTKVALLRVIISLELAIPPLAYKTELATDPAFNILANFVRLTVRAGRGSEEVGEHLNYNGDEEEEGGESGLLEPLQTREG